MRYLNIAAACVAAIVLSACALFAVPTPETFNERAVAAYESVTAAAETAGALFDAGEISAEQASDIHARLSQIKEGIDIAVALRASGDFSNADTRLAATIAALETLKVLLGSR